MVDVSKSLAGGKPWATYQESAGNDVRFYHLSCDDAAGSSGAFHDIEEAIGQADTFIFIADWSFHPNMRLRPGSPAAVTSTVGHLLNERAKAGVLVAIHTWDHTNKGAPDTQNDDGNNRLDAIARAIDPKAKRRSNNLLWRASSRTGVGWSHHQKFIVLDGPGAGGKRCIKAFLGGLDLTRGRFEVPGYPVDAVSGAAWRTPLVVNQMGYDEWYNAEFLRPNRTANSKNNIIGEDKQAGLLDLPRQPWEDFHAQIAGPAAWDVLREFVGRWERDEAENPTWGDDDTVSMDRVLNVFRAQFERGDLTRPWEPQSGPFTARIVRSMVQGHWGPRETNAPPEVRGKAGKQQELRWTVPGGVERSIQEAYLNSLSKAERFIYIENQYLIGSGAKWAESRASIRNRVPEAIVSRIIDKIGADQPFHAYIVVPMFPEGDPLDTAAPAIRAFEWRTMRYMAQAVYRAAQAKGRSWKDYLSFYFLASWSAGPLTPHGDRPTRVRANARYMIYVHSKLMIIDDEFLIVGSANLNERSLAGNRDSEIGLYVRPGEGQVSTCKSAISDVRRTAWTRLLGTLPPSWNEPQQLPCISDIRTRTSQAYTQLRMRNASSCRLVSLPLYADESAFYVQAVSIRSEDPYIVDAPAKTGQLSAQEWLWSSPVAALNVGIISDVGE